MAESKRFVCSLCAHTIESWSDGNPYYFDENGKKQYAYHPDHERLAMCIGNDTPFLCLGCGADFTIDSNRGNRVCPQCNGTSIVETYDLEGNVCPQCHNGTFVVDPDFFCIS